MKHPIQAKYLLIVILAMLAPTLMIGFCLYHMLFYLLAKQIAFPEAIMSNLVPVIDKVNALLAITMPLIALTILICAIVISHRFAGPLERLENELDRILEGDYDHKIYIRKKDDLKGVTVRINALVARMKKK
ncbi:MAG: hypothetical protein AUJ72_00245 [Candidatus Omnitrophica bacterium CG1_02_46_14]|nr:MAG: hypothetical protein AUJ72_00245 [Candidatus Omnitrophica bacterium CG1_02_46_14]